MTVRRKRQGGSEPAVSRRAHAFTLAEALIATVILSVAVVGIAGTLGVAAQQSRILKQNTTALNLARQLMEQVAASPFTTLGAYNGTTGSTATLQSTDGQSVFATGSDVYTWTASVEFRSTPSGTVLAGGDYALITVTVIPPLGQAVTVSRLASRVTWVM